MTAANVPTEKKSSTGKIIGFIGCGCLGIGLVIVAIIAFAFFGVVKMLKSSDAYKDSIAAVESNPAAIDALGEPIEPGFMPQGNISINNGEGSADFRIPVSGPKGSGEIHVIGTKSPGTSQWQYTTWELNVDGATEPIPLGQ
ncbi:MAG: hypothetical protein CMO55_13085 [Verrucomicrobiales bacterium]|nr:hypothetical protein [Verrucomicrobiales bacterium]